jgi:hypothetical protein
LLAAAEQRRNLSNPVAAWKWIQSQPWCPGESLWTPRAQENWPRNLIAFRSLARRLRCKKGRVSAKKATVFQLEDGVAMSYLFLLRPVFVARSGGPWFEDTFVAVELGPTMKTPKVFAVPPGHPMPERIAVPPTEVAVQPWYTVDDWDVFWQVAFYGLLTGSGPAVCENCGELLGRNRAKQCGKCRRRKWWDKQPQEKKREKWRTDNMKRITNRE